MKVHWSAMAIGSILWTMKITTVVICQKGTEATISPYKNGQTRTTVLVMDEISHIQTPEPRTTCPFGDPTCPCPDGLMCHYEGPDAWEAPESCTIPS